MLSGIVLVLEKELNIQDDRIYLSVFSDYESGKEVKINEFQSKYLENFALR